MGVGPSRWGRGRPFGGNLVTHTVGGAVVVTGSTPSPEGIHFPFDGPSTGVVQAWSLPQLSPAHFCTPGINETGLCMSSLSVVQEVIQVAKFCEVCEV